MWRFDATTSSKKNRGRRGGRVRNLSLASLYQNWIITVRWVIGQQAPRRNSRTLCCQGDSQASTCNTRRLRHQFCCGNTTGLYLWSFSNTGSPIFQIHTSSRSLRRSGLAFGPNCSPVATYRSYLFTTERREFPRRNRRRCRLGCDEPRFETTSADFTGSKSSSFGQSTVRTLAQI